jgi:hypothetical protein
MLEKVEEVNSETTEEDKNIASDMKQKLTNSMNSSSNPGTAGGATTNMSNTSLNINNTKQNSGNNIASCAEDKEN